jgi:hypothetical protein
MPAVGVARSFLEPEVATTANEPHRPPSREFPLLEDASGIGSKRLSEARLLIEVASRALAKGSVIHYLGSSDRLGEVRAVLSLGGRGLKMQEWRPRRWGWIGKSCREAFPEVLDRPPLLMAALGLSCLPPGLINALLHGPPGQSQMLVIDGADVSDPDVRLVLDAISAYCKRGGVTLAIFP